MKQRKWLWWVLTIIAVSTLISGVVQLAAPGFVLRVVSAESTPVTRHFFGIVGMFMALFGGLLAQALLAAAPAPVVLLWAGLQKIGASMAVVLGVIRGIFGAAALAIAAFDLVSGVLLFFYRAAQLKEDQSSWKAQGVR